MSICGARLQVGGKLCAPANALRHVLVEVAQQPRLLIPFRMHMNSITYTDHTFWRPAAGGGGHDH